MEENFISVHSCFLASPNEDCELSCFDEAKGVKEWVNVMDYDMHTIMKNQTRNLVPKKHLVLWQK